MNFCTSLVVLIAFLVLPQIFYDNRRSNTKIFPPKDLEKVRALKIRMRRIFLKTIEGNNVYLSCQVFIFIS